MESIFVNKNIIKSINVRSAGIEPAPDAWEAPVLPLNYDRKYNLL